MHLYRLGHNNSVCSCRLGILSVALLVHRTKLYVIKGSVEQHKVVFLCLAQKMYLSRLCSLYRRTSRYLEICIQKLYVNFQFVTTARLHFSLIMKTPAWRSISQSHIKTDRQLLSVFGLQDSYIATIKAKSQLKPSECF